MSQVSAFILDFEKYKAEDLRNYLSSKKNIDLLKLTNKQKIFSQFIRYFVLEKFYDITTPIFEYKHGKPYLKSHKFYFNISHTKNKAIIVFANHDIGVDAEEISSKRNVLLIAERYFTNQEYQSLKNSEDIYNQFYRLWTLKEAQVKRSALGIARGLSDASFIKRNTRWISNNYPEDFFTFNYQELIISICCQNIANQKIDLYEIQNFEFIGINITRG
ncbi:4'-phosphopantetheinyl transferase family protein [Francisella philomiragia]|uniref:4'-phosphopantetheinyl transferase family protein n=1 Tax=Francisella philomiragia TaxID=28110 RepID=UPI00190627A7|nr:4'-phosphopantetheinyl transferase superfamily protein [Francisella philomiragia]MBK2267173.1 4'-phosphopantetheinyl transferase superfamily protein [Francisella philomiragia]MBK2278814.1 4'-phosphopantetheinyl transferase superfamily protein [Francisella philomiragia]MBK2286668.1 4'-phosphopantetheinyl transferase superfamily protein [Francisella philomiragia]MBK2288458.1 4'-phosphopantetheinyl transferase superfamily protein [Francisella philomiragia]MBK2290179.1 4'-phosphopantetheinyl tr